MPPLRADRNPHGGGLLIYIKEGVPAKEISKSGLISKEIEIKVVEINLHKIKWLLIGIYRPPSQSEKFFFEEISKNIFILYYFILDMFREGSPSTEVVFQGALQ